MDLFLLQMLDGEKVGPLLISEIGELFFKKKITGKEQVSLQPNGPWISIKDHPEISKLILNIIDNDITLVALQNDPNRFLKEFSDQKESFEKSKANRELMDLLRPFQTRDEKAMDQFEFEKKAPEEEIKEKKSVEKDDSLASIAADVNSSESDNNLSQKKNEESKENAEQVEDKEELEDYEKTQINPMYSLKFPKEEVVNEDKEDIEADIDSSKEQPSESVEQNIDDEDDDSTAVNSSEGKELAINSGDETVQVNLYEIIPSVKEEVNISENELASKKEFTSQVKSDAKKIVSKRKVKPMFAFLFVIAFALFLFDGDGDNKNKPRFVKFRAIQPFSQANPSKANAKFAEGIKAYKVNTFKSKVVASALFKESMEHKYRDNPALGMLIRTYSDLLYNSREQLFNKKLLFSLIKLGRLKARKDVNVAIGEGQFFMYLKKPLVAKRALERFLRINNKKTPAFLTLYLEVLLELGDFERSKKVKEMLQKIPDDSFKRDIVIAKYYLVEEKLDKALELIRSGISKYSSNVPFLLFAAQLELEQGFPKRAAKLLKLVKDLNFEESAYYFSHFLAIKGYLFALNGKTKKATELFVASLKLYENEDLRSKLSALEVGGSDASQKLIKRSKSIQLIKKSDSLIKDNQLDKALMTSIQALDEDDSYYLAAINLAKVHVKQGFYQNAINTLQEARKKHRNHPAIGLSLTDVLIQSYKIEDAQKKIGEYSNSPLRKVPAYIALEGKYFNKKGDLLQAISAYRRVVKIDPLHDNARFELAKLFFKLKRFYNAKEEINYAIEIDPTNIEYHIFYGKILYEMEDLDVALGYLRDLEKDFPKDSRLTSNIAILYYRAGKIKDFERLRKQLFEEIKIDKMFFRFLIRNAILDGNEKLVIEYSKELIRVDQSDLENRMLLARYLFEGQRYSDCLDILMQIKERLLTYPKLFFEISKVYFVQGKLEEAEKAAKQEIENNPMLPSGYVALGRVYNQQKRYGESQKQFDKALRKDRKDIDAIMEMAWIKFSQNYFDEAMGLYRRALDVKPNLPAAHRQMGYIYRKKGQGKLAYDKFRVYLDLVPDAEDANRIKSLMNELK